MSSSLIQRLRYNPLLDTSRGDFSNINHPHHRHLFGSYESDLQSVPANHTKPASASDDIHIIDNNTKNIRQQMHEPESEDISSPKIPTDNEPNDNQDTQPQNDSNLPSQANIDTIINAKDTANDDTVNDLDDILEQQMEDASVQREQALETQIATNHREHNILKFYILVLIFALMVMLLVSKWGRTKLIQYAHRFGLDHVWMRITDLISQNIPLLGSINDTDDISFNMHSGMNSNKNNPRRKLHIKDPSEGEKLISSSINDNNRTKELFEPTLFDGESSILSSANTQLLHSWLPIRYNWLDWRLLYDLNVDGSSMWTFYENVTNKGPLIMIIKDERGYIFGVFIAQSDGLNDKGHTKRFFGGADTFVFRLYPNANKYEWTKQNRFFVYFDLQNTNNATITIGGGKSPALTLMNNLSKGISQNCDTFGSPQLSSSQEFTCIALEVWGLIDYK